MKKTLLSIAGAGLLAIAVFVYVNNEKKNLDAIFNANVEALTNSVIEPIYYEPIWEVYHREDGGINCTKGGNQKCI